MAVDTKTPGTKSLVLPDTREGPASKAGIERRREPRYPCNDPVQIRIPGDFSSIPASVMKVSRSGLCVEIGRSVLEGAQLEIRLPRRLTVSGEVRYCRRVGTRYQVGIMLPEASGASSKSQEHVSADQVASFLRGKGLTNPQVLRIREHLALCSECLVRMIDAFSEKRPRAKS